MHTSLDDLDRLAFLLARTVRSHHPAWLTQGFTLGDLESRLLPFRDARRELADGSMEAFERLVLRLLTGERGYLLTDPDLREAARRALEHDSPTVAHVRPWATTRVVLARPSAGLGVDRGRAAAMGAVHPLTPPPLTDTGLPEASAEGSVMPPRRPGTPASPSPPTVPDPPIPTEVCVHCGCARPAHRAMSYCPYCGVDLRRRQCPACSTELELDWRYCVTCGRGADTPLPSLKAG